MWVIAQWLLKSIRCNKKRFGKVLHSGNGQNLLERISSLNQPNAEDCLPNNFRNEQLAKRLTDVLAPFLPLFTSIMTDPLRHNTGRQLQFGDHHYSEGVTERWMGIVKNDIMGVNPLTFPLLLSACSSQSLEDNVF